MYSELIVMYITIWKKIKTKETKKRNKGEKIIIQTGGLRINGISHEIFNIKNT